MFMPTIKKPENVCFWCHEEVDELTQRRVVDDFNKYYRPCPSCRAKMESDPDSIMIYEEVEAPGLIDQSDLDGMYPTGRWLLMKRNAFNDIFGKADNDLWEASEETHSVGVSPQIYAILIDKVFS